MSFTDRTLERDYIYARALEARLPRSDAEGIDIGAEVKLTHLRTEQTFEGALELEADGDVKAVYSGKGPQYQPEKETLSTIIQALNERFDMNLDERDQLLFDQFEETWATGVDARLAAPLVERVDADGQFLGERVDTFSVEQSITDSKSELR